MKLRSGISFAICLHDDSCLLLLPLQPTVRISRQIKKQNRS